MRADRLQSLTRAWRQATATIAAALLDDMRERVVLWGWPDDQDRYDSWRAERDAEEGYLFYLSGQAKDCTGYTEEF